VLGVVVGAAMSTVVPGTMVRGAGGGGEAGEGCAQT